MAQDNIILDIFWVGLSGFKFFLSVNEHVNTMAKGLKSDEWWELNHIGTYELDNYYKVSQILLHTIWALAALEHYSMSTFVTADTKAFFYLYFVYFWDLYNFL